MLLGWQQTKPPNLPCSPELDVTSPTTVTVRIRENVSHHQNQPIITKYRGKIIFIFVSPICFLIINLFLVLVEWSSRADFSNICGWREVRAAHPVCTCTVTGLTRGRRYFFRAQGGNLKGWGPYNTSTPNSVLPSSKSFKFFTFTHLDIYLIKENQVHRKLYIYFFINDFRIALTIFHVSIPPLFYITVSFFLCHFYWVI